MRPTYHMAIETGETTVFAPLPGDAAGAGAAAGLADTPKERRVYFEVFGCQMNKLDAEIMLEILGNAGYRLTHDPDEAGVILYNTCSVRQQAEERVYSRLGTLRRRKLREPDLVIGLLGCIAQHHGADLFRRMPHLDLVIGTREFHKLPSLIAGVRATSEKRLATELDSPLEFQRTRNFGPNRYQAYVSVMRGCDMVCTYCIVPTTRGKEVSHPPEQVLAECRRLAETGVREVTLLGQTVNSYGKRLGTAGIGLHTLLYGLEEIDGIDRVRFITSHPRFMRPLLVEAMAKCRKSCEYLHLPVQSGADSVLKRMKRTYDRDYYLRVVERCRAAIPNFAIATDFIVGFPGETDAEFQASLSLVREVGFDHGYVFKYSPRPGTEGYAIPDDVPDAVKRERNQILLDELGRVQIEKNRGRVGARAQVLVEGPSKSDPAMWTGRTRDHRIVVWPKTAADEAGTFAEIEVAAATALTLRGHRVGAAAAALAATSTQ